MSNSYKKIILNNILPAIKSPLTSLKLIWRRLFPFGIVPKDKEAYRIGSWSYGRAERVPLNTIFKDIENTDILVIKPFDRDITTSLDTLEINVLNSIVKYKNSKRMVEVGTFNGNTSVNLAANSSSDAIITTLDLPPDWDGKYNINVPDIYVNVTDRNAVGKQIPENNQYASKIKQVFGDSAKLDWSSIDGPFDFVFIDGNHHYDYVCSDTNNAWKHLSLGGVIIWHDYGMIEDVSRAVDEFCADKKLYIVRGTRLAISIKD